jgi:class 3 adenylate cyclase
LWLLFTFSSPVEVREAEVAEKTLLNVSPEILQLNGIVLSDKNGKPIDKTKLNQIPIHNVNGKPAINVKYLQHIQGWRFLFPITNKTIGLGFELFLNSENAGKDFEVVYSSALLKGEMTGKQASTKTLPIKEWTEMKLWLPLFQQREGALFDFQFCNSLKPDPPLVGPQSPQNPNNNPLRKNEIFLKKIYFYSFVEVPVEETLTTYRKNHLSHFETNSGKIFLFIICISAICLSLLNIHRRISAKLYICFSIPFISGLLFFLIFGGEPVEQLEKSELNKLRYQLNEDSLEVQKIEEQVSDYIMERVETLKIQLTEKIAGEHFDEKQIANLMNKFYYKEAPKNQVKLMLSDGEQIICSHEMSSIDVTLQMVKVVGKIFAHGNLRKTIGSKFMESPILKKESEELRNALRIIKDSMQSGFKTQKMMEDFIRYPGMLIDLDLSRSFGSEKSLHFWTHFPDKNGKTWVLGGACQGTEILRIYKKFFALFLKRKRRENPEFNGFTSGFELILTYPEETLLQKDYQQMAEAAKSLGHFVEKISIDQKEPLIYRAENLRFIPSVSFCLSRKILPLVINIKDSLNYYYYLISAFIIAFLFFSLFLSMSITRPFSRLKSGLLKISQNDFSEDIQLKRKDQFGQAVSLFNQMLENLRERDIIARFLPQMALESIDELQNKSWREEVCILYCKFQRKSNYLEKNEYTLLNELLPFINNRVAEHDGLVDKFTGDASLFIFRSPGLGKSALQAALDINTQRFPEVKISIGIATGPVVLGMVGSDKRKDFTAIGDTVNLAARLSNLQIAKQQHNIFLDENSYRFCETEQKFLKPLPDVPIKGKTKTVNAYYYKQT